MTSPKNDALPELLAGLKALVAELQNDNRLGDDGIPLLTTAVATPAPAKRTLHAIGAAIPTLSTVIARPEKEPLATPEKTPGEAIGALIQATAIVRRADQLWRETGNAPLEPAMIAALERALAEALQNP